MHALHVGRTLHGIPAVEDGRAYQYAEKQMFWLHDGFIPMPIGDLPVHILSVGIQFRERPVSTDVSFGRKS